MPHPAPPPSATRRALLIVWCVFMALVFVAAVWVLFGTGGGPLPIPAG